MQKSAKAKQTAMLQEWIRDVLSNSSSITVKMDRVPIGWEKDFQDWPTMAELAAAALENPAIKKVFDSMKLPAGITGSPTPTNS